MSSKLGQFAKKTLEEYVPIIDKKLARYWDEEISLDFGFNDKQKEIVKDMLVHAKEHNLRASKRLRGSFVRYGYLLGNNKTNEKLDNAEMAIELVHTALLMHDDFMDQDNLRRGKPTTHKYYKDRMGGNSHYGDTMAVNIGDAVLCLGFQLLQDSSAMNQLLRGITNTAWGQAYDVTLEAMKNWTEEDVIVLHKAKTAIYTYENPLFIGAQMAKLPKEVFEILHDYAMDGGVAFQLQDDILGVFGDEEKTGKSADSDLRQGKCTLLVLKAFDRSEVKRVWGNRLATKEELDLAKKAIVNCGSYEYNMKLAQEYAIRAAKTAERLRSLSLNLEAIDYIQGIAEYMVTREV